MGDLRPFDRSFNSLFAAGASLSQIEAFIEARRREAALREEADGGVDAHIFDAERNAFFAQGKRVDDGGRNQLDEVPTPETNAFLDNLLRLQVLVENRLGQLSEPTRLFRPPGCGLLWFADFFYSRKSVEEYLRPTIRDLQDEYVEALAEKRARKATWVRIRGTWSFLCVVSALGVASFGKQLVKMWRAVS